MTPPTKPPSPEAQGAPAATLPVDQCFVDRIIARAQNCMMGLGDPKESNIKPYDLSNYADANFESVAIMLVSAHEAKYDLVSLMWAAMEEVWNTRTPAQSPPEVARDAATVAPTTAQVTGLPVPGAGMYFGEPVYEPIAQPADPQPSVPAVGMSETHTTRYPDGSEVTTTASPIRDYPAELAEALSRVRELEEWSQFRTAAISERDQLAARVAQLEHSIATHEMVGESIREQRDEARAEVAQLSVNREELKNARAEISRLCMHVAQLEGERDAKIDANMSLNRQKELLLSERDTLREACKAKDEVLRNLHLAMMYLASWIEDYNRECDPEEIVQTVIIDHVNKAEEIARAALSPEASATNPKKVMFFEVVPEASATLE